MGAKEADTNMNCRNTEMVNSGTITLAPGCTMYIPMTSPLNSSLTKKYAKLFWPIEKAYSILFV